MNLNLRGVPLEKKGHWIFIEFDDFILNLWWTWFHFNDENKFEKCCIKLNEIMELWIFLHGRTNFLKGLHNILKISWLILGFYSMTSRDNKFWMKKNLRFVIVISICIVPQYKIHYKMDFNGCFFLSPLIPPNHALALKLGLQNCVDW